MHIDYKAPTVALTPDVQAYVEEKLQSVKKLLQHVDEGNIQVEVELSKDTKHASGEVYRADITVHAASERTHAVGHGESLNAAVDEAKDELMRRLRREKGKKRDLFIRGAVKIKKRLRFWE